MDSGFISWVEGCFPARGCDWSRFQSPRFESKNFATRYQLVYPALACFVRLAVEPGAAGMLRPALDSIYGGLMNERCWGYWHTEQRETTAPLERANLTFRGRLATFLGLYRSAFGDFPAPEIRLGDSRTSYSELSEGLRREMQTTPSRGVCCYRGQAMVPCNAHLLLNNILHDRLFGTSFADANGGWMATLLGPLSRQGDADSILFYGTASGSTAPRPDATSLGVDTWSLFLMSGAAPVQARTWFERWREHLVFQGSLAWVPVASAEQVAERSSVRLASAWGYCLAREMGDAALADKLRAAVCRPAERNDAPPILVTGLLALGDALQPSGFRRLVEGIGT